MIGISLLALTLLPCTAPAAELDLKDLSERVERLEEKSAIKVGGALRINYGLTDWSEASKDKGGDFAFDTFRLNLDGEVGRMILSAEYRWYPEYDFDTIHHGYLGYNFNDELQGQIGVHQVPFGIQPYASHNFWFSGAYYVGLEDDYDMGVKLLYEKGPWDLTLAFYKNGELGSSADAGRYSVDVNPAASGGYAGAQAAGNEETNQGNARAAYTFEHGELGSTEVGLSAEYGQLYNGTTGRFGDHWAGALHLVGNYGRWNLQLEGIAYGYDPQNPAGFDDDIITLGGYGYSWGAPAEATIGTANLAYTLPVNRGPIDSLTFYSDNTVIAPKKSRFATIWQNVVGVMVASGPVYTYIDVISGEEMIFLGGDMVGASDASAGRNTRLNVNFGYYF